MTALTLPSSLPAGSMRSCMDDVHISAMAMRQRMGKKAANDRHAGPPMTRIYDRIASRYDRLHGRWLRHAGGSAQTAFEAALVTHLAPGQRLLDAGCGTGQLARRLLAGAGRGAEMTLLDASAKMLAHAADLPVTRTEGCLMALPFADQSFDIVTAAWCIEATPNPARALRDLLRVLCPGGRLFVVFCARTDKARLPARLLCEAIRRRGTGTFLDAEAVAQVARAAGGHVVPLPCDGPAAAMMVVRPATAAVARAA